MIREAMSKTIVMTAPITGELADLADFTCSLATTAASVTRSYFRKPIDVIQKLDSSPVTIADRECEARLRDMITERFPGHGILGEEHGFEGSELTDIWVIDPIDGTKSFISGLPLYGTLIAFSRDKDVRIGAISMPELDEFWIGIANEGSYFNGTRCHTSDCRKLEDAILMTTALEYFSPENREKFAALREKSRIRRYGGDCYIYAMVASGWADLAVETGLQTYDYMALIPVIEEAGGVITDWSGKRPDFNSDGTIVAAATKELHQQALEILGR
ncbi:histidinol-phosphatase [Sneathiella sp. HT1-7]|jgi:histidinol phosphatase-like enzyme (inositol monophosphatase family)|uniref:histidinol-phosphatase n=1 Tax=Sneathiella sp. HT1-7 TaxID=2887192 RepID=UPI001D1547C5|nr:histidinol-phosphatase [Sneathiella sp. HT1-7]MCC3305736.1 histidinol-phosphatase [Sneathiella sp. HT1-7]